MSDNLDVVPEESVVDSPSDYEAADADEPQGEQAEAAEVDEEPVSLDDPEPEDDETEAEAETEDEAEAEDEPEDGEEDFIEFDFGGNKLKVKAGDLPAELAETVDKFSKDIWADYTRKSQDNAETAKTLKARDEALGKIQGLSAEALDTFSRGKGIKSEIEQLSQIDMQALWQSDPDQARQVSDRLSAKQAELQSIITAVDQYERQIDQNRQAELERISHEGKQLLDRKYKGFSSEIAPKIEAYAVKSGIPEHEAKTWSQSPIVAIFAYKAMLYDQMQAAGKPKVAPKIAKPVRSMPNKGGNRNAMNQNDVSFSDLGKILGIK